MSEPLTDNEPIPLARPELGEREEELVLEVLRSGRLSLGPMGERFERAFAEWLGVEDAVAVSSGTTALHLGVRALGWGEGDEVLTSPFSFVASANCLLYEGARPVFCDVDPVTLDLDPGGRRGGGRRAHRRAPAGPHLRLPGGDVRARGARGAEHGLGILEDACEALGAVDADGRGVGTRGNLATFAFYANKQMTTGEGGMLIPPSAAIAARLRSERNQGRAADMDWLDHGGLGFNYRLSDVAAAIGVAQVEKLDSLLERRSAVAAAYAERLAGMRGRRGAARRPRRGAAQLVRLPGPRSPTGRPRRDDRPPRRARHRLQGLPALHPPVPAPAGARLPRGPVPGRRRGVAPLARAALLHLDDREPGRSRVRGSRRIAELMSRFRKDPDPRFWRLNRSLDFDWQLAPYDIDQSQAHARGLSRIGVLDEDELDQIVAGLERVRERIGARGFAFEESDEDIHMAIERLLGEEIGPLAGKLHTGRSRNDQVATDVAMVVQAHSLQAIDLAGEAMEQLLAQAERHRDWPMPGYTHLQRAQPVYLGHHLLAYFWMLARDVLRFQFALDSASVMPLGSGALAGVNWEIDRGAVADDLGFEHVTANSIDGASNRDFVLDYLAAASTCAMHLSRLGSEIVIWSSTEFGFCRLDESFSSGSSIMPQKKNPDSAELLRAKSPRVAADYLALLGHDARAAADLRQGHAGGQGAALRRDRHDRVLPRGDRRDARRDRVRPRAARGGVRRRDAGGDRDRRPARRHGASPSARPTGSSAAWSATRSRPARASPS